MADLYRVLGVERDADPDRIKKAYKRLVRQYHPDVNQSPGAADRFQEIKKAYEVLSDPEDRKMYDHYGFETKILAASVRSPHHVHECAQLGCDIATIPKSVFDKLYYNPLTDMGLEKFQSDWDSYTKNLGGRK